MLNNGFCSAILLSLAQLCYSAADLKTYVSVDSNARVAMEEMKEEALLSVDEGTDKTDDRPMRARSPPIELEMTPMTSPNRVPPGSDRLVRTLVQRFDIEPYSEFSAK